MQSSLKPEARAHWSRPSALLPLVGFGASLLVHGATFAGADLTPSDPLFVVLHLGTIIALGSMVLASRANRASTMGDFELPRWPAWAYAAAIIVALYAFGNFLAFLALSQGGTPEVQNGIYTLANHGRVIRTLTPEQYHWQQAYVVRGFSGHWLAGQLIPALYFLFRDTPSPEPGSTAPAV